MEYCLEPEVYLMDRGIIVFTIHGAGYNAIAGIYPKRYKQICKFNITSI